MKSNEKPCAFPRFRKNVIPDRATLLALLVVVAGSISASADDNGSSERKEMLMSNSLKAWRDYFLSHKTAPVEEDLSGLENVAPDHLAIVPLETSIVFQAHELVAYHKLPLSTAVTPGNKVLIVSYSLKYGSPKWVTYGLVYFYGRPKNPPDEFELEAKIKLYLFDMSTGDLIGYPEQTNKGNTPNDLDQDEAIPKLFDDLLSSLDPAPSKLKEMLKESRDTVSRVAMSIDQDGELSRDIRRKIALAQVQSDHWQLRQRGVEGLIRASTEQDIEMLLELLDDKDSDVRATIVKQLNDKRRIETLGALLLPLFGKAILDEKAYVRSQAAECLGKTGLKEALMPLLATLKDEDQEVRKQVAQALGQLGVTSDTVMQSLIEMLDDSSEAVAEQAAKSLDMFEWQPKEIPLRIKYLMSRRDRQDDLVALGRETGPALIEMLQSEVTWQAVRAAEALGKTQNLQATESLIAALEDSPSELQHAAATALGNIKDASAVEALIACLDKEEGLAVEAAQALSRIAGPRAVEALVVHLRAEGGPTRKAKAAAHALQELKWHPENARDQVLFFMALDDSDRIAAMGKVAVDPLLRVLASTSQQTRVEALHVLERIGAEAAAAVVPISASLRSDGQAEIIAAVRALAMIEDKTACEFLLAALQTRQGKVDEVCLWIRFALARLSHNREEHLGILTNALPSKSGDSVAEMLSMLSLNANEVEQIGNLLSNPDPDVRKRVVAILGHVGRREAVDKLWEQLAQEEKEEIRRNIRDAIRQSLSKTER